MQMKDVGGQSQMSGQTVEPSERCSEHLMRESKGREMKHCGSMRHARMESRRPQRLTHCSQSTQSTGCIEELASQPTSEQDLISLTDRTSVSHLEQWHEAHETLIFFDWDDTLFPTSFVWNDDRLHWSVPAPCLDLDGAVSAMPLFPDRPDGPSMRDMLEQHAKTTAALLKLARTVGHVVIVTLANEGWVETSIHNFLPALDGLLEELGIEVIHARNSIPARVLRGFREDEGHDCHKALKARAMERVIRRFYSKSHGQTKRQGRSWKNVLSIGDSMAERLALQDVVFRRRQVDKRGMYKACRCKCVKLLDEPCLGLLTAELQVLLSWMRALALHDGDIDVDFADIDEESPLSPFGEPA
mmetsp:Transcript_109815/g.218096  ORF Transcript_109815/g.218096 Transcript_109815/m.218096 type:complete len:358 (-) Transcript_109815:475-1548(-)